jgi:hypothetical protein
MGPHAAIDPKTSVLGPLSDHDVGAAWTHLRCLPPIPELIAQGIKRAEQLD